VRAIRFGSVSSAGISVELDTEIVLEFEGLGEFSKTPWNLSAVLAVEN
jgi:hypothetical protein